MESMGNRLSLYKKSSAEQASHSSAVAQTMESNKFPSCSLLSKNPAGFFDNLWPGPPWRAGPFLISPSYRDSR